MEDLENGLDEKGLIGFVKTVLLSGNNPRGKEAIKNLEWGIKQYRKQLILHGVVKSLPNDYDLGTKLNKYILEKSLDTESVYTGTDAYIDVYKLAKVELIQLK